MKKQRQYYNQLATSQTSHEEERLSSSHKPEPDSVTPAEASFALSKPTVASHRTIMALQQTHGNQKVLRLIQQRASTSTLQRGLFSKFFNSKSEEVKVHPNSPEDALDSDIFPYFAKFCERTMGPTEVILFLDAYKKYKSDPNFLLAKSMYDEFIDPNGKNSLNLQGQSGGDSRRVMENQVADFLHPKKFNTDKDQMYEKAYKSAILDLYDPYSKFKLEKGKEYQAWLDA